MGNSRYPGVTPLVAKRIFETKLRGGEKEMDFRAFLDFVLATQHKSHETSLRYFWEVLDLNGEGYLTWFTVLCFLQEIRDSVKRDG
jgi:Ca2+-binding EF-hand superfamily protein